MYDGDELYWEEGRDHWFYGHDNVDIAFACTHGGVYLETNIARYAMYECDDWAYVSDFRLGDDGEYLSILNTYACETLTDEDSFTWTINRWDNAFQGGLLHAHGSHGSVWSSPYTDECGYDYADELQGGTGLSDAWHDGLTDWYHDQDIAVLASGTNSTNCSLRKGMMYWDGYYYYLNFYMYPKLRDQNLYYCATYWDDQ